MVSPVKQKITRYTVSGDFIPTMQLILVLFVQFILQITSLVSVVSFLMDHPFNFYRAGHFSPSFRFSQAHIELSPLKYYTTSAKLFNIRSVQQFKEKLAAIPEHAHKLFAIFEYTIIDFSFVTHKTNEKETFKLMFYRNLVRWC